MLLVICSVDWSHAPLPNSWPRKSKTAPFQYALSTRVGSECVAHVVVRDEPNSNNHDVSVPVIPYLEGLCIFITLTREAECCRLRGSLWHSTCGRTLDPFIRQGEGGEQGYALMPLLFSLGQHGALQAAQEQFKPQERLMVFSNGVHGSQPERVGGVAGHS